jgi:hypothetical protein
VREEGDDFRTALGRGRDGIIITIHDECLVSTGRWREAGNVQRRDFFSCALTLMVITPPATAADAAVGNRGATP